MTTTAAKNSFWKKHIDQLSVSNLSRAAYCSRHGLKLHQLNYHQRRLRGISEPVSGFAQVILQSDNSQLMASPSATLVLSGGNRIDFYHGADPIWASRLILQLGGGR